MFPEVFCVELICDKTTPEVEFQIDPPECGNGLRNAARNRISCLQKRYEIMKQEFRLNSDKPDEWTD